MKRSARAVKPSGKYPRDDDEDDILRKSCECSGCPCDVPICFARASAGCAGNRWTSRWYHISMGEHYCNECFEYYYRSHKEGYGDWARWKLQWSSKSRLAPSVRGYFCSELLPYWLQCQRRDCGKWRQLSKDISLTQGVIQAFRCGLTTMHQHKASKRAPDDPCSFPEDERVGWASSTSWPGLCRYTPYLQYCPANQFLTAYYQDGVGLSPLDVPKKTKDKLSTYQQPFPVDINHPLHANGFTPDMMTLPEIEAFPLMAQEAPYTYLGLRNLVLVLWALNPKEWLTKERCQCFVVCRGLARVYSVHLLSQILFYLTHAQVINVGLVSPPSFLLSHIENTQDSVLVIGAGMSGLAAAYTLKTHGFQVTVLEARDCIGGRLGPSPEWSNGYVLTGVTNNPLALMAMQTDVSLQSVKGSCQLMTSGGKAVDAKTDRRIEFHYNAILDIVSDWRKGKEGRDQDASLADKFNEFHEEFIRESQQYFNDGVFSQEEQRILQFHLCNLEFTCGCSMDRLSSLYWDHNESLPQFAGKHVIFPQGMGPIVDRLADGLDIRFKQKVTTIDYSGGGGGGDDDDGGDGDGGDSNVLVKTEDGQEFKASKVIMTLPLGVLKQGGIEFHPDLPEDKRRVIGDMGSGHVEMVALQFSSNFWSQTCPGVRMFGRIPSDESQRGVFNIFQGISTLKTDSRASHHLISYIVGGKVEELLSKSDQEIVSLLMETLRAMFHSKSIPEPSQSLVTRWRQDPLGDTAYSFLPVGCDGSLYDLMAQEVGGKIFFAGEATCRQFPQTVTGAYVSGVREARKIIQWR